MKLEEINNCEKCGSSYSTYDTSTESKDGWLEKWCQIPVQEDGKIKKPKGLCQFCNPKSKYCLNKSL